MVSSTSVILAGAVIVLALFIIGSCTLNCSKATEGYQRSDLGQAPFSEMGRSQVDYYIDQHQNPHWKGNPFSKWQPLEDGPVDLYADERFSDYPPFSFEGGSAYPKIFITNDEKGRADLNDMGARDAMEQLRRAPQTTDQSIANRWARRDDNVAGDIDISGSRVLGVASDLQYSPFPIYE